MGLNVMNKNSTRPSIDGFTLRRRTPDPVEGFKGGRQSHQLSSSYPAQQFMRSHAERRKEAHKETKAPEILPRPEIAREGVGLHRGDVSESLKAVEDNATKVPQKVESKKKDKKSKTKDRIKTSWYKKKKLVAGLVVLLILAGGLIFAANKIMSFSSRVFSGGNILDLLGSGAKLKADANGLTNVLIFGTSEDDPGHGGAELTDSIMVVSINQEKKTASMVSMPRDMWVDYGKACISGYSGKINVVYMCNAGESKDANQGALGLGQKVGEVFGLDVQYYVKVNYSVVRDVTTALGGVTVNIDSTDSRGIYDFNTKLRLPNGPATLQGEQALAFVRARGDGGGYGFEGSNFAREQNQQKMLVAIRDKSLSIGTLTNPVALTGLIDSLGDNVRTNLTPAETKTLAELAKDVPESSITRINLNEEGQSVVTTGTQNGQSIVRPIAGLTDYTKIKAYILGKINGGSVETEGATVTILNGSGRPGAAAEQQTELTQAGLIKTSIGGTSYKPSSSIVWYDTTGGAKPKTQAKLASILGKQPAGVKLPAGVQSTADFVIIIGNGTN